MKKFSFKKMSGAGNDFVLFDKNLNPDLELNSEKIKKICDRRNGIGADGVLLIEGSKDYDFTMRYFNADGNLGSLCGNGARCAIKYFFVFNSSKNDEAVFTCEGKTFKGNKLNNGNIKFYLSEPADLKTNFSIKAYGQLINSSYINTGSPHVVIKIQDVLANPKKMDSYFTSLNEFPVFEIGKEIRYSPEFKNGTNVNFIDFKDGKIFIRTYERGVEEETLACGTGSVAAAIICAANYNMQPPFELIVRGGDALVVDFEKSENQFINISLTGPAEIVYSGEISI
jgi:diaminopimelate epimerase